MNSNRSNEKPKTKRDNFSVELNIPSEMEMIRLVEELGTALMDLRGYTERDRDNIRLAIHETLVNAITHGSKSRKPMRVTVRFAFEEQCFYTDIEDEGEGFDLDTVKDPTHPQNLLEPTGRGIFLAQKLTENFTVTRLPGKGFRVSFCRFKPRKNEEIGND
ncbi:ATP-binding protein [bacterium]|nr:ATP-binding protein [candidate division CSSED10-310 bacterium]